MNEPVLKYWIQYYNLGTYYNYRKNTKIIEKKNRNSRLLGHVNFDGQNHRFVRKGNKNGFISGFGHYLSDFGYLGFGSKWP